MALSTGAAADSSHLPRAQCYGAEAIVLGHITQHLAAKVTTTIMFWPTARDERMYSQGLMGLHDSADCAVCPTGR